jgi:Formamidopyrimidine-DNA glycosylase N-terminal domain
MFFMKLPIEIKNNQYAKSLLMPELPEVEVIVQELRKKITGEKITAVKIY